MATVLRPEDVEEFTERPAAMDWHEGVTELVARITGRVEDDTLRALLGEGPNSKLTWRAGMDGDVMEGAARSADELTLALGMGRLGDWPVTIAVPGERKMAWSVPQLIAVVEHILDRLERTVAEQQDKAARQQKQP